MNKVANRCQIGFVFSVKQEIINPSSNPNSVITVIPIGQTRKYRLGNQEKKADCKLNI